MPISSHALQLHSPVTVAETVGASFCYLFITPAGSVCLRLVTVSGWGGLALPPLLLFLPPTLCSQKSADILKKFPKVSGSPCRLVPEGGRIGEGSKGLSGVSLCPCSASYGNPSRSLLHTPQASAFHPLSFNSSQFQFLWASRVSQQLSRAGRAGLRNWRFRLCVSWGSPHPCPKDTAALLISLHKTSL